MTEKQKKPIGCPDRETWATFVDTKVGTTALTEHLDHCDHCFGIVSALRLSQMRVLPQDAKPTPAPLLAQARALPTSPRRQRWPLYAAAAVILIAAIATLRQDSTDQGDLLAYRPASQMQQENPIAAPRSEPSPKPAAPADQPLAQDHLATDEFADEATTDLPAATMGAGEELRLESEVQASPAYALADLEEEITLKAEAAPLHFALESKENQGAELDIIPASEVGSVAMAGTRDLEVSTGLRSKKPALAAAPKAIASGPMAVAKRAQAPLPAPPAEASTAQRESIAALVDRYGRAYQEGDLETLAELRTNMAATEKEELKKFFATTKKLKLQLALAGPIHWQTNLANALVVGLLQHANDQEGQQLRWSMSFVRTQTGWRISTIIPSTPAQDGAE